MRKFSSPVAAVVAIFIACSSQAAEKPQSKQADQKQATKVWTNEDMDQLRALGLISIVGQEPAAAPAPAPAEAGVTSFPVYASRLDDPAWYADKAADLQADLGKRQAALNAQLTAISLAEDRITQPGLALDKENAGVTPAEGVHILQEKVQEVQNQLDALSDLARQHDILPGVLRG